MNANHSGDYNHKLLIERKELLEKLKASTQAKLTLVIAPAGYGKTTLVSQFVQATNIPHAWQTLETQDQDLSTLFQHSLDALSGVVPEISAVEPIASTTAGELATIVTDYMRNNVPNDFLYVLDDVHQIVETADTKTWLRALIATLPSNCHLLLVGRAIHQLSMYEFITHRDLVSLDHQQLNFSYQEVILLAEKIGTNISADQIENVYFRMLGWPAGTVLALQPLPTDIEFMLFEGEKAPEGLFDALADRLFSTQSTQLQTFLLSSSTLSHMTPGLCQAALHLTNSSELLTQALKRNLFIAQMKSGLAYHSLFRDFLQRKLQRQNPAQFIQHHMDAGQWFESENRLEEAVDHFIFANQWERAARIAEQTAHIYLGQGKLETLLRWERVFKNVPVHAPRFFHFCAGINRDRNAIELALDDAKLAENGFRFDDNNVGLVQIALLRATIDNQRGRYQEAFDQAISSGRDLSIRPGLRGYALVIAGTAALCLHNLEDALDLLQTALPLYRNTGNQYAVAQLLMTLEVTCLRLGHFSEATQCIEEVIAIRRDFGESVGIVMALNNLGYQYHLLGQYQKALQTLKEGLSTIRRIPENLAENSILWTLGNVQRDRGAFDEAAETYRRGLQRIGDSDPVAKASILISFSTLRRWQGKLDEAHQFALEAQAESGQHNLHWESMLAKLALEAVLVNQGGFEVIRADLEAIILDWTTHPSPQLGQALSIYACGALSIGDSAAAHHVFNLAVTYSNHPANLQPLIAEVIHTTLLKSFVESHKDRYVILNTGLACLEKMLVIAPTTQELNVLTYSLRVSLLGREVIERDGKQIPLSDWQAASAREMFFYLLFKGASSREDISVALWSESSAEQVQSKFHTTLRRGRDAIGDNAIIYDNQVQMYFINPNIDLWCDAIEFQSTVQEARLNPSSLIHTENLWHRAIDLYRGDFLPAFDVDWVTYYRQSLHQKYINSLMALGNCLYDREKPRDAVEIFKRALQEDSYREDIHRALFSCYDVLGEKGLISQHMKELTHLLDVELGTTPSLETIKLVQKLLG